MSGLQYLNPFSQETEIDSISRKVNPHWVFSSYPTYKRLHFFSTINLTEHGIESM